MNARTFREQIELDTKPKHTSSFGNNFDSNKFAKKAGIHSLPDYKLFCGVERKTKDGIYIPELSRVWEGHSYLRTWYNQLRSVSFAVDGNDPSWEDGDINFKEYDGTLVSQAYPIVWQQANGFILHNATSYLSIVPGSDNTAVDEDQHGVQTVIVGGSGAGQLVRSAPSGDLSYDSTNLIWSFDVARLFTGNGTDSVDVAEIALYSLMYNNRYSGFARDLVSPPETIAVTPDTATFHYIIQQINPA